MPDSPKDFAAQLSVCEQVVAQVDELLDVKYDDARRTKVILAYTSLAIGHHVAIIQLMRSDQHGSALALVRPVFETMLRAHWVVACAKDEEVDQMCTDAKFDVMGRVDTGRIDAALNAHGFFKQAKNDAWAALNDYTHSGLRQLVSQFSGQMVKPNYKEVDVLQGLRAATASVLLLGHLVLKSTGRAGETSRVETLFDSLAQLNP
jgi:hypothetical protein